MAVVGKLPITGCLLFGISSSPHCLAASALEIKPKLYGDREPFCSLSLSSLFGGPPNQGRVVLLQSDDGNVGLMAKRNGATCPPHMMMGNRIDSQRKPNVLISRGEPRVEMCFVQEHTVCGRTGI